MTVMTRSEALAEVRANQKRFYTYILHRPNGIPFYVGIGKGERVGAHERPTTRENNKIKNAIIRKIKRSGGTVGYLLSFFDSRSEIVAEEKRLIAKIGRIDLGTGTLSNLTDGGEGQDGRVHSADTREKMSLSHKRGCESAERREAMALRMKEQWSNPDHRKKVAIAKRSCPLSEDARARIDASLRNRKISEETREKLREVARKRIMSEETRAKIGAASRGRKLSDDHRAKISAGLAGHVHTQETRARLSAAATRQHERNRAAI